MCKGKGELSHERRALYWRMIGRHRGCTILQDKWHVSRAIYGRVRSKRLGDQTSKNRNSIWVSGSSSHRLQYNDRDWGSSFKDLIINYLAFPTSVEASFKDFPNRIASYRTSSFILAYSCTSSFRQLELSYISASDVPGASPFRGQAR